MNAPEVRQQDKDEWRDFILRELVSFLSARKEEIYSNYSERSQGRLPLETIEAAGLMDFELAVTFLQDKRSGLGRGFLGMNLIQ